MFAKTGPDAVKEMIAPRLSCLHRQHGSLPAHGKPDPVGSLAACCYTATYIQQPRIYPEPPARFRAVGTPRRTSSAP